MARLQAQSNMKTVNCHGRCAVSLSFSSLRVAFRDLKTKHFFPTVPICLTHSDGSSLRNSHQAIAVPDRLGRDLVARRNDSASPDAIKGSLRQDASSECRLFSDFGRRQRAAYDSDIDRDFPPKHSAFL